MEQKMHPKALKAFRDKRGWTQEQLADKCGCTKETVSRWERGKIGRVRSHSRERLIKVLGVTWEEITRAPGDEHEYEMFPTVQLNVRVEAEVPTALDLVCLLYGLRRADVVRLAPLLFLITAEKSLARRQANLDAIEERIERAVQDSRAGAPHLEPAFHRYGEMDDALYEEEQSIKRRDVFHRFSERGIYDVDDHDPYTTYLKTLAADIPSGLVEEMVPGSLGPSYTIAEAVLHAETGISGDNEEEQKLLRLIRYGDLDLHEVLSAKKRLSQDEYLHWLSEQREVAEAKELEALLKTLGLDKVIADRRVDSAVGEAE